MNTTDQPMNRRPVIDTSLIPDHVRQDIAEAGYEAFLRYCKLRQQNPEVERKHQMLLADYRRRQAEKAKKGGKT